MCVCLCACIYTKYTTRHWCSGVHLISLKPGTFWNMNVLHTPLQIVSTGQITWTPPPVFNNSVYLCSTASGLICLSRLGDRSRPCASNPWKAYCSLSSREHLSLTALMSHFNEFLAGWVMPDNHSCLSPSTSCSFHHTPHNGGRQKEGETQRETESESEGEK